MCFSLQNGLYDTSKKLIDSGADVTKFVDGKSPMYFAFCSRACTVEVVKMITHAGFPDNGLIDESSNLSALHGAVTRNELSIVQYMLEKPINMNVKDVNGFTPLHYAVRKQNFLILELLVNKGADIDAECGNMGYTPLFYAVTKQNAEMVKLLLKLGADVNHCCRHGRDSLSPLHMAAGICNLKIVQVLLDKGANVNNMSPESKETPLHVSSGNNTKNMRDMISSQCIVRLLIQRGSDLKALDESELTPLHTSVRRSNYKVAKVLICHDNSSINTNFAFHEIMKSNERDLIELCLSYGADLFLRDPEGRYPAGVFVTSMIYRYASDHRSMKTADIIAVIKIIWRYGFPVELTVPKKVTWSKPGIPPFLEILKQLIRAQNTLFQGIKSNNTNLVRQAIERGAVVLSVHKDLQFPLHFLASKGNVSSLKLYLFEKHLNVNSVNKQGKTPLHLAAEYGHLEFCIILLENGAIYNPITKGCKRTPLELARKNRHSNVVEMLKKIKGIFQILTIKGKLAKFEPTRAALNCKNRGGNSLMLQALENGLSSVAGRILKKKLKWKE